MGFFQSLLHPASVVDDLPAKPSVLDIVVYTAGLASNPQQIDPYLDQIRLITAKTSSDSFTAEQQATMRKVYLELEDYLVSKEPLRKFTRQDLRARFPRQFTQVLDGEYIHE